MRQSRERKKERQSVTPQVGRSVTRSGARLVCRLVTGQPVGRSDLDRLQATCVANLEGNDGVEANRVYVGESKQEFVANEVEKSRSRSYTTYAKKKKDGLLWKKVDSL